MPSSPKRFPLGAEVRLAALLERAEVFEDIDSAAQSMLLGGARCVIAAPGTPLLRQGEVAGAIYYVVSGLVGIEISEPTCSEASLVDLVWERGFFGSSRLRSTDRLPFGASAIEECQLLRIDGRRVAGALQHCGQCARGALHLYESILMRSVKLHRLRLGDLDSRLGSFMELFGPVSHRLTKAQIASIIGVSTASLYRAINIRQRAAGN